MRHKTIRFLVVSLIIVVLLCSGIFIFQVKDMNEKSAGIVNEIGEIYIGGM